ncbi:MAG: hypothetical protein KJO36_09855 [Acidimicrobiia bacterium]|nr:hypothetical protein [Acidimicrobiia bacterium]
MTIEPRDTAGIDARISRLEAMFESFLSEWQSERSQIRDEITLIRRAIEGARGINWGAASVVVTIVGMAAALVVYAVSTVGQKIDSHVELDGHPPAMVEYAKNNTRLATVQNQVGLLEQWAREDSLNRFHVDSWRHEEAKLHTWMDKISTRERESTMALESLESQVDALAHELGLVRDEQTRRSGRVYKEGD